MTDTQEQFDLTPQIEEPVNGFKIVHLCNQSDKYHLTRQVLLDSSLTQDTYCFFYHILAMNMEEFNKMYGSFACLIDQSVAEADLYLNVDADALRHIVKYIQTGKINGKDIYADNWKTIDEIIDLATMFGMPELVTELRNLHPSESCIGSSINMMRECAAAMLYLWKKYVDDKYDVEKYMEKVDQFIDQNKEDITNTFIKSQMYNMSPFTGKLISILISLFLVPLVNNTHSLFNHRDLFNTRDLMEKMTEHGSEMPEYYEQYAASVKNLFKNMSANKSEEMPVEPSVERNINDCVKSVASDQLKELLKKCNCTDSGQCCFLCPSEVIKILQCEPNKSDLVAKSQVECMERSDESSEYSDSDNSDTSDDDIDIDDENMEPIQNKMINDAVKNILNNKYFSNMTNTNFANIKNSVNDLLEGLGPNKLDGIGMLHASNLPVSMLLESNFPAMMCQPSDLPTGENFKN